ncbi:MAG: AI-2E family transporter [Candidatus Nomurabacteria bacterium]
MQPMKIELSARSIIKIILLVVLFYALYYFRALILILFLAIVIASVVNRFANLLGKVKIPRVVSVVIFYLVFLSFLFLVLYNFLPAVVSYIGMTIQELPNTLNYFKSLHTESSFWYSNFLSYSVEALKNINTNTIVFNIHNWLINTSVANTTMLFSTIVNFILTIVISIYISVSDKGVHNFLRLVSPKKYEDYVEDLFDRVQKKISGWFFGQVFVAFIISILFFIILTVCQVPFALPIAFLAFICELMPLVGVTIASIPALFFAWNVGGFSLAFAVLISIFAVSQISSYFLYPKIIGKFVGIPTVVVIIALFIGVEAAGFWGALIAIPVATIAMELLEDFKKLKENQI